MLSKDKKSEFTKNTYDEYLKIRKNHKGGQNKSRRLSISEARKNKYNANYEDYNPKKPSFMGNKVFKNYNLEELRNYIDWTPFFRSWDLHGSYPNILKDQTVGSTAQNLYKDANNLLDEIINNNLLCAKGVIGFWPANSDKDDIILFNNDKRNSKLAVFHTIRQQDSNSTDRPNYALADFIAPLSKNKKIKDYIGGFALTCGHGENELSEKFKRDSDDYNSIMTKALADRLAEAFAERMHERVRKEFWGYSPKENLNNDALIKEKYSGIRPAHGYPAQPDHTEKGKLFEILEVSKNIDVSLTESFSMLPGASISGLYFSNPESNYFGVGKISKDQVKDYAKRKSMTLSECEKWLMPILNYK